MSQRRERCDVRSPAAVCGSCSCSAVCGSEMCCHGTSRQFMTDRCQQPQITTRHMPLQATDSVMMQHVTYTQALHSCHLVSQGTKAQHCVVMLFAECCQRADVVIVAASTANSPEHPPHQPAISASPNSLPLTAAHCIAPQIE